MIIDYVGREKAMHIVAKYDQLVLVPLLVKVSWLLNPSSFCFGSFLYLQIKTLLHLIGEGIMPLEFHTYHFLRGKF